MLKKFFFFILILFMISLFLGSKNLVEEVKVFLVTKEAIENTEVSFTGDFCIADHGGYYGENVVAYDIEFLASNNSTETLLVKISESIISEKILIPDLGWDYECVLEAGKSDTFFGRFIIDESVSSDMLLDYLSDFDFNFKAKIFPNGKFVNGLIKQSTAEG